MPDRTDLGRGVFMLLITSVLWALAPLLILYISRQGVDAHTQNALRYLSGGLVMLGTALVTCRPQLRLALRAWPRLLVTLVFLLIYQHAYILCINLALPATAVLITRSYMLWTILLSTLFFPEERAYIRRPLFILGTIAAVAGMAGVILGKPSIGRQASLGIIYAVISAFFWSCYTAYAQRSLRDFHPAAFTSLIFLGTVPVFAVLSLLSGRPLALAAAPPGVWWAIFLSGALSIGVAQTLNYAAMRLLGLSVSASITLIAPFLTALGSWLVYDDKLTVWQIAAGLVLVGGIYLSSLAGREKQNGQQAC